MISLWSILKTPIPGLKRRSRVKSAPWVLRRCPASKRGVAVLIFTYAGLLAHIILFLAAIIGIFLIPLFLIAQHPDAPIAVPMRWLRQHFSPDTVFFIYTVIWGTVVFGLTYATMVLIIFASTQKAPMIHQIQLNPTHPNQSPEPTAVGVGCSAIAVRIAGRRGLSFFR